ncbi:hypothetical protein [Thomasclavelia saccharogumia]|uniref:hypothetical protein n=1 Tax=Thomasclavelia saccharogumia TaxID=341225 RepID=UPI000479085F|nr:hypothetical protein [Thomasclavelia saccharogumia]
MDKKVQTGGMGITSTLTLIFIVLKSIGLIDWSWIWVLSPVWISGIFFVIVFTIILIGGRIRKGKW